MGTTRGIQESSFRKNLALLIEEGLDRFFIDVRIIPIIETQNFLEAIAEFDEIKELSVYLVPSNPSYRDQWAEVDSELQEVHAESFSAKYKFVKNAKTVIPENSMLERFLAMMADGYGRARAIGWVRGALRKIHSEKAVLKIEIPDDLGSDEAFDEVAPVLEQYHAEQIEDSTKLKDK